MVSNIWQQGADNNNGANDDVVLEDKATEDDLSVPAPAAAAAIDAAFAPGSDAAVIPAVAVVSSDTVFNSVAKTVSLSAEVSRDDAKDAGEEVMDEEAVRLL